MTSHSLFCTLCSKNYYSRKEWNQHLIQNLHQEQARIQLGKWTEKERKRALIIYSDGRLLGDDKCRGPRLLEEIVKWLEDNGGRGPTFVGDLVLSPNGRENMAILQVESKKKVSQILAGMKGPSITIGNQMVQLKRLDTVLELEWIDLLERFLGPDFHSSDSGGAKNVPSSPLEVKPRSISVQFQDILQSVKIPDEEVNLVQEIIQEIKGALQETLTKCDVGLFRNQVLGLRINPRSDKYLVYICLLEGKDPGFATISREMKMPLLQQIGKGDNSVSVLRNLKLINPIPSVQETSLGDLLFHPPTGIYMELNTYPLAMSEFQLSRLLIYYTHFDIRVKPLLTLLYFWIKENQITLAGSEIKATAAPTKLPDPVGLEWLLMFYLYHKEKLIPVPQTILERPHKPILFGSKQDLDLGFHFDLEFATKWKNLQSQVISEENSDEYFLSVVNLFRKFCMFYSQECFLALWGLDLRVGDVFLSKKNHQHAKHGCKYCVWLRRENIAVIHPLGDTWRICVNIRKWQNNVRPSMGTTATKLQGFIENWKDKGQNSGNGTSLLKNTLVV